MRRIRLFHSISIVVCFVVVLNFFAGSLLCLLNDIYNNTIFRAESETDMRDINIELIKIPIGISISNSDFERMNDHEIMFHKKLYDVVKYFEKGDFQYFYCIYDSGEEKILEQVKQCNEANLGYFNSKS